MWYLHAPDRSVPYEITMKAVNDLYQEGYFTRLGISNHQVKACTMRFVVLSSQSSSLV